MIKIIKNLLLLTVVAIIASCAAIYKAPQSVQQDFTRDIKASKDEIFNAAKQALILEGYQVVNADKEAGIISTGKKQTNLTEADTDCGTTMGIPYIKDKRTITTVSIGIVVTTNKITIRPAIEGEYLKGHVNAGIDLHCISKGTIEESLYKKIVRSLP